MNRENLASNTTPVSIEKSEPEDHTPPAKRQRVSQACSTCRDRKTRCDGRQPICLACEQRGVASTCNFDKARGARARPSFTTPLSQGPASKLFPAEPIARNDAAQVLSDLGRQQQPVATAGRGTLPPAPFPVPPTNRGSIFSQDRRPETLPKQEWGVARADGLATIAADHDDSMYGPSSIVAFMRHVMPGQSRPPSSTPDRHRDAILPPRGSGVVPDRLPARTDGLAVLPRRRQADDFLLCYWEFVHPLFPVLHRPTFLQKYAGLWAEDEATHVNNDSETEEAIFTATLNLVFALGSKFSRLVDLSQKTTVADDFYQRARQAYPFDVLDSTSVSLVQMLVLTGIYLQSTERASRCWNSVGLAIRIAQSLGLHVDHGIRRAMSPLELQMRRRIWHTCIHLDRLLAMTFGRPSMIGQKVDVPIPDLLDDEYLGSGPGAGTQPNGVPSRLGLFISSCNLFQLLEEILELFYRDDAGVSSQRQGNGATRASQLLAPVLDLNRRLDTFSESIPDYLRTPLPGTPASISDDHVHLQQQVLYCRFLYVRLLSLRPLLLMAIRRDPNSSASSSLDDDVICSCCSRCVVTACCLIDTLFDNLGTLYRSSGWHTVYFTFTSAMVLLASSKLDDQRIAVTGNDVEGSWAKSFAILRHYEDRIHSARQASKILQSMKATKPRVPEIAQAQGPVEGPPAPNIPTPQPTNNNYASVTQAEICPQMNLNDIDFSEAWFGQHLINLDWLELPQL